MQTRPIADPSFTPAHRGRAGHHHARWLLALVLGLLVAPLVAGVRAPAAAQAETIRLDYAYYNPSSLVLRRFGWLEEELGAGGTEIEWT
ncbi:MAG: hypothetical protein WKF80_06965, partial [Thermomicrobiales bacterium]